MVLGMEERYVRIRDVCRMFNVSHKAVYTWIRRGWINAIKLPNGEYRIPLSDVERLKTRRRVWVS